MNQLLEIQNVLHAHINPSKLSGAAFCKKGPGSYAEHDQFIGVDVPTLRRVAKDFHEIDRATLQALLGSKINEERLLALFILINRYTRAKDAAKNRIYDFYMQNLHHVNNWNLVDSSAHLILGAHLKDMNRSILITLAQSSKMWERRIAIVATWSFIKNNDLEWTFKISEILLKDSHDLIHKAVGWMLREAGKKDVTQLIAFLDKHGKTMPRTALRYAIEKFPEDQRKAYLLVK